MKIRTITFSGSNPSMGPHNSPSRRSLSMGPYPQQVEDLLDETQVNGAASLRDYLALHLAGDQEGVQKVHAAYDCGDLRSGQRIIDLVLDLEDGPTITLSDLRTFSLEGTGWKAFNELIREEGTVTSSPSPAEMRRKLDFDRLETSPSKETSQRPQTSPAPRKTE